MPTQCRADLCETIKNDCESAPFQTTAFFIHKKYYFSSIFSQNPRQFLLYNAETGSNTVGANTNCLLLGNIGAILKVVLIKDYVWYCGSCNFYDFASFSSNKGED